MLEPSRRGQRHYQQTHGEGQDPKHVQGLPEATLAHNSVIPLLGIYLKEHRTGDQRLQMPVFKAAVFTAAKGGSNPGPING